MDQESRIEILTSSSVKSSEMVGRRNLDNGVGA